MIDIQIVVYLVLAMVFVFILIIATVESKWGDRVLTLRRRNDELQDENKTLKDENIALRAELARRLPLAPPAEVSIDAERRAEK